MVNAVSLFIGRSYYAASISTQQPLIPKFKWQQCKFSLQTTIIASFRYVQKLNPWQIIRGIHNKLHAVQYHRGTLVTDLNCTRIPSSQVFFFQVHVRFYGNHEKKPQPFGNDTNANGMIGSYWRVCGKLGSGAL